MKKMIVAFLAVIALFAFTACIPKQVESSTSSSSTEVTVGKPVISLNEDNSISWAEVSGATEYIVEVNGIEQQAQTELSFAPIIEVGTYSIRVKCVSGEYSGEWSDAVSYTVTEEVFNTKYFVKPALTLNEDKSISWEAIEGASGYVASVNGKETEAFTGTTFPAYTEAGTYAIKVKAVGEKQGLWSDEVTYTIRKLLTLNEYDEPVSILKTAQRLYVESTTTASNPENIYNYTNSSANVIPYFKLEWKCILGGNVTYTVEISENEDFTSVKTFTTENKYAYIYNLYNGKTYYYKVTAENELGVSVSESSTFTTDNTGPRVINVEGVPNVRDIGGYLTESGKRTLQGMLFRGAEMDAKYPITEDGKKTMLEELGIKSDVDLRGNTGITESPLGKDVEITFYPIGNYLSAFNTNGQTELYRQIFSYLADANNYPAYIHCQGGADRTGTVVFLLNALLGVPLENLIEDQEFTSFSIVGMRFFYPSDGHENLLMSPVYDKLMADYEGDTLSEKVENYMLSIGVTETEIYNLKAIMFGEPLIINVNAPAEVNVACQSALNLSVSALGNKTITSVVVGGIDVEFTYANNVISVPADEISSITDGTVNGKVVFSDGMECEFSFVKKDYINVNAKSFNILEDTVLTIEISDIGETTVSKVILAGEEVNFTYDLGKITVPASELESVANGVINNGTIVLSNNRELTFAFSKLEIKTVLLTDYIAKGTKLDATNASVTSAAIVGYNTKVKGLLKSEGATASAGGIDLWIGSYGIRLRGKELRIFQNGSEIARHTGLTIDSDAFNNGNLYFTMWVEELSETKVRVCFVTATADGSESVNAVDYSYDFTVGSADIKSESAVFHISITADVTSVTLLDDGGTGANIPKEYVTVNLTDYIPAGTTLDSSNTTVTSAKAVGYGVKVKMLIKTEDVSHTGGGTIISIGSYGFELRGGELRIFRDGAEEKMGVGLTLQSGVFNNGNIIATMWVDIVDEATARLNLVTETFDGSASENAVERHYDFTIKSTDVTSENAKVTITISTADVPSLTVLNEDGSPIGDEGANTPEEGSTVYLTDYVTAGTVVAVGSKVSTKAIGFGTKIKMLLDAEATSSGGLLLSIGSYGFYHRSGTLRVYRDGSEQLPRPSDLGIAYNAFNSGSLYITMWVELVNETTARLHFVTETVDGSESGNVVELYYDFTINSTDVASEDAVFTVSPMVSGQGSVTILADKAQ